MTGHGELVVWAGAGNVHRADPSAAAAWDIPAEAKRVLVDTGIPVTEQIVAEVGYQTGSDPRLRASDGRAFYRLTKDIDADFPARWHAFGVTPVSGEVFYVLSDGQARFTNSSVPVWIRSLHHFGRHLSRSWALQNWSDDEEAEETALEELRLLADDLRAIDPAAFDGYEDRTWPAFLDRWLW